MKISEIYPCEEESIQIRHNHVVLHPSDIHPLEAYLILKDLFGEPNGDFDETKSQWSYLLHVPGGFVDIYDWKTFGLSIAVILEDAPQINPDELNSPPQKEKEERLILYNAQALKLSSEAEKIGKEFQSVLRKHLPKIKGKIKKLASNPPWLLIQNPYAVYYSSAKNMLEKAKVPDSKCADISDYCRSAFFLFFASFEGFLNLIYELYLRQPLRDERISAKFSREQVDMKVRLAPIYCECFSDEIIDHRSEVFRNFQSLVNLRNDFIHANFTKPMRSPIIIEDAHFFILNEPAIDQLGLPKSMIDMMPNHIDLVKKIVDRMVYHIIHNMKPRYKNEFMNVFLLESIGVRLENGVMILDRDLKDLVTRFL